MSRYMSSSARQVIYTSLRVVPSGIRWHRILLTIELEELMHSSAPNQRLHGSVFPSFLMLS